MNKVYLLVFICFSSSLLSDEILDVRFLEDLARKGKDKELIKAYKEDPALTESIPALNMVANAYYRLGDVGSTVITCAKSMKLKLERGTNPCGKILSRIRREQPEQYELSLAQYYIGESEYKSALVKYHRLLEQTKTQDKIRAGLVELYKLLKQPDHVKEQLEFLTDPKKDVDTAKWLETQRKQYSRSYGNLAMEKIPHHDYRVYTMLFLEGTGKGPYFQALTNHYEGQLRSSYTAQIALRLANLYLLGGDVERARDVLGEMDFRLTELGDRYTITDRLAREAILRKLPKKVLVAQADAKGSQEEKSTVKSADKSTKNEESGLAFAPPILSEDPGKIYAPFDFTHIDFATNDDLRAFSDLKAEFNARLENATDPFQKRWIFEKVNKQLSMQYLHRVYSHNEDPLTLPIGRYFASSEGQAFQKQLDSIQEVYKKQDKENSKQFEGTAERLDKELGKASSLEERSEILKRFYVWWDSLLYREKDPFKRGAFAAYMDTKEGVLLMKKARRAATRVNDAVLH